MNLIQRAVFIAAIMVYGSSSYAVSCDSLEVLFHFSGIDTSSWIGETVTSVGDINGDGYSDISFTSRIPDGSYIFFGGSADTIPAYFLRGRIVGEVPKDMNGDGFPDVLTRLFNEGKILFYRGIANGIESVASDSLMLDSSSIFFGGAVATGFSSPDSLADLLAFDPATPGGWTLYYYENPFAGDMDPDWQISVTNNSHTIGSFDFIDFNGDGFLDVFVVNNAHLDSISFIEIYLGPSFPTTADITINPPEGLDSLGGIPGKRAFAKQAVNVGDYDGDSWSDLAIFYNVTPLIYRAGPSGDTLFDYRLVRKGVNAAGVGDVNGDNMNDVAVGGTRPPFGAVDIYLGGNFADEQYDYCVSDDELPILLLDRIGYQLSSAGDYNNDGLNDILFSTLRFFGGRPGDVFVVAGTVNIITDVEEEQEHILPTGFRLSQNYPNPFNPETSIQFEIPERSYVKLVVYNILGKEVIKLVDRELPAGKHTVKWDSRSDTGKQLASGIYLYKLSTGKISTTRKMLLLK